MPPRSPQRKAVQVSHGDRRGAAPAVRRGPSTDDRSRHFVGLVPDAQTAARLAAFGLALARTCGGRALAAPDLHLTLAFIGPWRDSERPVIAAALSRVHTVPNPAPLEIARLGHFGRRTRPGVLWMGPRVQPAWLDALAASVRAGLAQAGIAHDERPLRAHLTLVRNPHALPTEALQARMPTLEVTRWRLALGRSTAPGAALRYDWIEL